jgi:hypothetical protein
MGGQITSKNIGGLTYEVTLTLYRDTLGIPMYPTEDIYYQDSLGSSTIALHTLSYTNVISIGNGVEKYEYIDTITFPVSGRYKAWTANCCRNAAIINIPNASSYGMYLDVDIFADNTNSSPVFLNEPITVAQLNQPFSYNPLPYDSDGDSLSWVLDIPLDVNGMPTPGYVLPYSDTMAPFQMDPMTGEITFIPNTIGSFQVSVKAIEWRNGIQIGYIRRDMQLLVVPSSNMPVNVQVGNYVQRNTTNPIYVNVGETLTFTLDAFNIDNGHVSVTTGGSALLNTSATSYLAAVSNNEVIATINWTPTLNEVKDEPYYLSFRIGDYSFPYTFYNDYTFRVIVTNTTTGLNEVISPKKEVFLVKTIDILGREIKEDASGLKILCYSDGTTKKIYSVK